MIYQIGISLLQKIFSAILFLIERLQICVIYTIFGMPGRFEIRIALVSKDSFKNGNSEND
jgi:hypothetical protein